MTYFRTNIDLMSAYVPGEQPPPGSKVIKLNTNENPYPPSPKALEVLRGITAESLRRYPDPISGAVRRSVGRVFSVPPEWVIPGNGSDELLAMIVKACCEPGRPMVYPMPTYVLYRTLARMQDCETIEVPFDDDYRLPLGRLIEARGALTIIASPNSPSGTVPTAEQLRELARNLKGVLAIDEAYVDFAEENALDLVREFPNVIVLRTLSKGYSLAGLRLGFGIARPELMEGLFKVKDSYNVDAVACAVGAAAIDDQAHKEANAAKVKASRGKLASDLGSLGFRVWPSQANFLLVRPPQGDAERLYHALKDRGILVRYFNQPQLEDKLRISIGTDEQNGVLIEVLSGLLA